MNVSTIRRLTFSLTLTACCATLYWVPTASTQESDHLQPLYDFRLCHELASNDAFDEDASAVTFRLRLGAEAQINPLLSALIEDEIAQAEHEDFNSLTNGKSVFPVVISPLNEKLSFQREAASFKRSVNGLSNWSHALFPLHHKNNYTASI